MVMAEEKSGRQIRGGPGGNRACVRWFGEMFWGERSRRSRGKGCTGGGGMVREWKEQMEDQGLEKRVSRVNPGSREGHEWGQGTDPVGHF